MPPLQKQSFALQFAGGIDSKTDSKQVPTTKLLDLQNAVFIKQSTLAKRNGYKALGRAIDDQAATISDAVGLAARVSGAGDELIEFAGGHAYSYRPSTNSWSDTGEASSAIANDYAVARTGSNQTMPDHATNGGVTAVAWEDSNGGVWCSVLEAGTARILLQPTQLDSAGISPRCVVVGTVVHVYYAVQATSTVWCAIINPASPSSTPAPQPLIIDLSAANPVYDACPSVPNSGIFPLTSAPAIIAWATNAGHSVGYVDPSGQIGTPALGYPVIGIFTGANDAVLTGAIAVAIDRQTLSTCAVLWNDPTNVVRARTFGTINDFTNIVFAGQISDGGNEWIRISAEYSDSDGVVSPLWWVAEDTQSETRSDLHLVECSSIAIDGTPGPSFTGRHLLGHSLLSRAFYDNGDIYATVVHGVEFFPYAAIVRISGDSFGAAGTTTVARLLPGLSAGAPTRNHVASAQPVNPDSNNDSRQHVIALGYRIQLSSANGDQFGEQGVRLVALDFDHADGYSWAQLGWGLYLSGALMLHYDGKRWAEADFHCAPDTASGAPSILQSSNSGGSLTSSDTYGYIICYEGIDNQGELHQGACSIEHNITLGGSDNTVTITIPTYRLTSMKHVRIGVYRSRANDSSEFFRVTSTDPSATAGANCYVLNDPTVQSITFIDKMSDATLQTVEPLYTNGGILSNDPTQFSGRAIAIGKSRLFWTSDENPYLVRYSQTLEEGDFAAAMPASLSQETDPFGGSVSAVAVMDGAIFAFKETAIYVMDGPGPDADGGASNPNNAFTPFSLVTSDVGCKSPRSICQVPDGIVFQSSKGIKLLGRDRQVRDIGRDVYAFNDQTITRATLMPDRHQVVFLSSDGTTLLWDYERLQWSKFTNHQGLDGVVANGVYYYLRNDGRVFQETPGIYADDNRHIPMLIETAWVHFAEFLQGFQKVLHAEVVGTYKSSHQLQMRWRFDYQDAYYSAAPIDVDASYTPNVYGAGLYGAGSYGGSPGPNTVYQEAIHINQRCEAISLQFSDIESAEAFGAAFELSELLLTGGVLGGRFPVGATRSQ